MTPPRATPGVLVVVLAVAACGSGPSRPSDEAWATVWHEQRDLMPAAEVFLDEGEDQCGTLVGELRSRREELLPTPTDGLDDAVHAWINHAESIAFDCPTDQPEDLAARLHDLEVLAAEVDAGLDADRTP